jgi:hypothetical protein
MLFQDFFHTALNSLEYSLSTTSTSVDLHTYSVLLIATRSRYKMRGATNYSFELALFRVRISSKKMHEVFRTEVSIT